MSKTIAMLGCLMIQLLPTIGEAQSHLFQESVTTWSEFLKNNSWQDMIVGRKPESCGCGLVYDLPNYLNRPGESFALADMRGITYSEPHYHSAGVTEIYFFLQGEALVVVGGKEMHATVGTVIVTPPLTAHYVIPDKECVLAVVNVPAFRIEDYHVVTETNHTVGFDKKQFERLTIGERAEGLKVYVAAKFSDKERVRGVYAQLRAAGHHITAEWFDHKPTTPFSENKELAEFYAQKDINGVLAADIFILLSHAEPSMGASAELGAAIASYIHFGKPKVFVVGPHFDVNFAFYHPCVQRVASVEEVIKFFSEQRG